MQIYCGENQMKCKCKGCTKRNRVLVQLAYPRKYSGRTEILVDGCIAPVVQFLNELGVHTVGSCCGHNRYKPSVIIERNGKRFDLFSKVDIDRIRNYYKSDPKGLYYIPENHKF